jgi:hypothetical protein
VCVYVLSPAKDIKKITAKHDIDFQHRRMLVPRGVERFKSSRVARSSLFSRRPVFLL